MIVNESATGLEVIYQPAHALLSAQVAARWERATRPANWEQTLVAVSQHDNGWIEWEMAPTLTEEGKPRNFTETTPSDAIAQWRRGVARGRHQGRWVGLLISRHATALYSARRGELPALDEFLDEQARLQARWIEKLGVAEEVVARAYDIVRWSDWFSLVLCWRRLPADGSFLSLGEGPDGRKYQMRAREEGVAVVAPWPFIEPAFTVTVEARALARRTFESPAALRAMLEDAPVYEKRWEIARE